MKSRALILISVSALGLCVSAADTAAATYKVLYSFPAESYPYARLEHDETGKLYGALYGSRYGKLFRLKQQQGASWAYKALHRFKGSDGANPFSGLAADHPDDTFYGTTEYGGTWNDGTIFSLVPSGRSWMLKVIYNFTGGADGSEPLAVLMRDKVTGTLYGTTSTGGPAACGTIFALSPSGADWTFNTLYRFKGGDDGCYPCTQLQQGPRNGTLVGATTSQGGYGHGTVFELTQTGDSWSEVPVYSFQGGDDGGDPIDIDVAGDGTVYGVTQDGGMYGHGVGFQLAPHRDGWTYTAIHQFEGSSDGSDPRGIRFYRAKGVLYGTTLAGGSAGLGTIFQLAFSGSEWTETVLHNFTGGSDGASPWSRPLLDEQTGVLYGTTISGGAYDGGMVYELTQ